MERIQIPEELNELLTDAPGLYTPYTAGVNFLYSRMVEEYFRKDFSKEGLKKRPEFFKSDDSYYQDLAGEINASCQKRGFINKNYLSTLCFPTAKNWTGKRDKRKLIAIYNYLDSFLTKNERNGGMYWIRVWQNQNVHPVVIDSYFNTNNLDLSGVSIINKEFLTEVIDKHQNFTGTEFYLGKQIDDCQWCGIIRGWDAFRKDFNKIKKSILVSFDKIVESKIALAVTGANGSGKSTFLRRLAIDLSKKKIIVLWVDNLKEFVKSDFRQFQSNKQLRFLIVIEDWGKLKSSKEDNNLFLSKISKINSVRLIIGDVSAIDASKEYTNYLDEKDIYDLSPTENIRIIRKVFKINKKWKRVKITQDEYYTSAPIYLILFGFAISNSDENSDDANVSQMLFNYKRIIRKDMEQLYAFNKGLALTLYYWACLYKEYKTFLSWEGFLKLADFYNEDATMSSRFFNFNEKHPICKLLCHYISLYTLAIPNAKGQKAIYFHNDLLVTNGLTLPIRPDWFFDKNIKIELLNALLGKNELSIAATLYDAFDEKNDVFKNHAQQKSYYEQIKEIMSFDDLVIANYELSVYLRAIFLSAPETDDVTKWEYMRINTIDFPDEDIKYADPILDALKRLFVGKEIGQVKMKSTVRVKYEFYQSFGCKTRSIVEYNQWCIDEFAKLIDANDLIVPWNERFEKLTKKDQSGITKEVIK